jgi:hypothetical protein
MRLVSLLAVASLACACVVEEPIGVEGVAWSEATEPEIEPIVWRPSCHGHYEDCMKTKLSKEDDYGTSRCKVCADLCEIRHGEWPAETNAGKDCRYWRRKYQYPRAVHAERSP